MDNLLELSLAAQVSFGAGYAGYSLAYAGLRQHHSGRDAVFLTLVFGIPVILIFQFVDVLGPITSTVTGVVASLAIAGVWRRWGRKWALACWSVLRIHRDDGTFHGWAELAQTDCQVGQISVHTRDGRVLYLNDRREHSSSPWKGLYLGGDGSIIMAVEEEELADGTEEVRAGVTDPDFGTRMTYLPASEIVRVNLRMK